jgi:hypothetical protein
MKETALGLRRTRIGWVVVEYTIEGGKVVEEITSTPEIRRIVIESFLRKVNGLISRSQNESR